MVMCILSHNSLRELRITWNLCPNDCLIVYEGRDAVEANNFFGWEFQEARTLRCVLCLFGKKLCGPN